MSTVGSEHAALRHPRLASLATGEWPAWLWSADGSRILWANAVGAAIFGAESSSAYANRRFSVTELPAAQVLRLVATLPTGGQERLERLRGFGGSLGRTLTCTCSRIVAGDGRGAVLIVAAEPAGPPLTLAERVQRLVEEDDEATAAFTPDGRLVYANARAQHWLNGTSTLAALGLEALAAAAQLTGVANAAAKLNGDACDILLACLGQGASSVVLVVVQHPAPQTSQTPAPNIELETAPGAQTRLSQPSSATAASAPTGTMAAAPTKAAVEIGTSPERRHPLRFVWHMDADGSFNTASDEFPQLIGARTGLLGRRWCDIASELKLDPADQVAAAVASRETWSGITVSWPIPARPDSDRHSELRLPIELSGLPIFDRDRNFRGYRGFGVCRDLVQINGLAQIKGSAQPARGEVIPAAAPLSPPAPHERAITATPAQAPPDGGPGSAVVVPFRRAATADSKPAPTLTPIERRAFRELAQELTSRLRGAHAAAAEAVTQELGQERTLSQDELRQVLSQALNQESGEAFAAEPSDETIQETSKETSQETNQEHSREAQPNTAEQTDTEADEESRPGSEEPSQAASKPADEAISEQAFAAPDSLPEQLLAPALLDRLPLGILVYRHDGLLYANRHFLDLSGYSDVAAIDSAGGLNRLFAEPGGGAVFADSAGAQALAIITQSGERLPLEGRMVTVAWRGAPAMALILNKPRSDAATPGRADDATGEPPPAANHEAERAATAKAEFVAKISHDIRNPLNAIAGFAEAMMSERFGPIGNERYREYVKDLHAAAAHLSSMVDGMFDLSKLESGRTDLAFVNVNLNEIVQQCVGMMQPQANRARIIIRSALTSGLPLVKADERALRQIVLNLLSNSIKLTGRGGQIIVSTAFSDAREAIVRVRDTGSGMTEKQIAAALEPFADIAAWANSGSGGGEFGLPLTKALAEANHAQFRIKSAPEAGTLVEIVFPPNRTVTD